MKTKFFNPNSARSVFIEAYFNETKLASGTAFFCESTVGSVLITNRHNVTGRNQLTDKPINEFCAIPNKIKITAQGKNGPKCFDIQLYSDDYMESPSWVEHPTFKKEVDVVGIVIKEIKDWKPMYVVPFKDWNRWNIGDRVSAIGFPFGISAAGFAIWSTGYIASEPDVDYDNLPLYLIDCRARQGQSGSPVIAEFKLGDYVTHNEKMYQAKQAMTHFLGIYSGRINNESDLGMVWKPSVVRDIIEAINQSTNSAQNPSGAMLRD